MQAINSISFLAFAQPMANSPMVSEVDTLWLWIRVLAFLGLMGAGAYFLAHYTRKKRVRSTFADGGKIVVADTCSLGNKQYLVVAQYGTEKFLVGVSSTSISFLSKLASDKQSFEEHFEKIQSNETGEKDA